MRLSASLWIACTVWLAAACSEVTPYRLEPGELFPDGKPVGQPYTSRMTSIRMVRVESVGEADLFFEALCRNSGSVSGDLRYTHEVPSHTHEVGIIFIGDTLVNAKGIREIHFVETIKPEKYEPIKQRGK